MTDRLNLETRPVEAVSFGCRVDDEAILRMEEPGRWKVFLARHKGKLLALTVTRRKAIRSKAANAYYWACVVPAAGDILSANRVLPLSKDDVHEVLKRAFLGVEETPLGPLAKSSRDLSIEEFHDYVEQIRGWAAQDHGVDIPGPGENWEAA